MRTALIAILMLGISAASRAAEPTDDELKERALKLNKETTNEEAANTKLRELNKDKAVTPRLVKIAARMHKEAKAGEKPFRFYSAMVLAKAAQYCKEYDAAETFYKYCFESSVKELKSGKLQVLAGLSYIDYYLARKQYDKAVKACEEFLKLEDEEPAQQQLFVIDKKLRAMVRDGQADAALDEIGEMLKVRRLSVINKLRLMMLKAGVLREAEKIQEAVNVYLDGLKMVEADETINEEVKKIFQNSYRYSLSGLYTEQEKVKEAAEQLEKLIEMNPDMPTYKNDLGFIWADHDMNLDKAEKLIREAVEQDLKQNKKAVEAGRMDPERAKKANSAYTDSLGWVLYKQKKYDEALKWLLESAGSGDEESDHIEIWDHVGDCYLAMGKKKEALESFQKGLKSEDFTKKDAERRRKVTEKANALKKELK